MNAWLMIEPDDTIIIRYPRSEMGQGSFTALPMIVAEELEADWSKVKAEFASANRNLRQDFVYGRDMSSVGSHSVRGSRVQQQQVGASARVRLVLAAAQRWGVPASECEARHEQGHPQAERAQLRLRRARGRRGQRSRSTRSRRSRRPSNSRLPARPSRDSTCRSRSTVRRPMASTPRCRAWSMPRSSAARCRAAR